ncbi:hypothetical protein ACS0TY_004822 [Phlomoides rotata]
MKSPLTKWRGKGDPKGKWDHKYTLPTDGLTQAAKDMKDMRTCYDSLLSAAAATANSAYEFSESLLEMGNCLLEKTAMHDDGGSRGALSMLGKVQLELQKLVDIYRSHIIMTITNPSECLLSELRKVEEMKLQCDEKRDMYEFMVGQFREKGKSRHGKGETFSSQQLKVVCDEYDDAAKLCIFRVESLKQGQSRSLLTQAARHHAAQINFFRKGLQSLGAVEPHIRSVAEKQHIDYEVSELNEGQKDDDEGNSFEGNDYGEISFDYRHDEQELDNPCTSGNSMELDQFVASSAQTSKVKDVDMQINSTKNQGDQMLSQKPRAGSHSAPIYAEKYDVADKIREKMRTSAQKLNTHVLPTPADAMGSMATTSTPMPTTLLPLGSSKNLWHSSPLDIEKPKRFPDEQSSTWGFPKSQATVEENNSNTHFLPPPPPLTEGAGIPQVDTRKNVRQTFSGPIASKPSFNKPMLPTSGPIEPRQLGSGLLTRGPGAQPLPLLNVSHNAREASLETSPQISELHELPRPPDSFSFKPRHSFGTLGHSAPLAPVVKRNREASPTNRNPSRPSKEGSPLPLPQLTVSRSFSIPSSSQRAAASGTLLESSRILESTNEVASPPLTPISLSNMKSPNSGQIRGGS